MKKWLHTLNVETDEASGAVEGINPGPYTRGLVISTLTVGASASLADLKGSPLLDGLKELILVRTDAAAVVQVAVNAAAAATSPLLFPAGTNVVPLPVSKALADTIRLHSADGATLTLIEFA